ncbi:hypothetical protein ACRX6C_000970 [Citrobacter freundii]
MTALNKQALRDSALDMIRVLGYIASFESEDIDGDDLELRFETEDCFDTGCAISITSQCQDAADVMQQLLNELEAAERRIAELEARTVTLPPLNDDLIAILGRPNFTCSHLAELMRKSGDEIRRKSEHEQAAVIHWFLGIYLEHGDKWEGIAKADIQSRVAAAGIGVKGE